MSLDLEAFSLLRLSGQTRPQELVQIADTGAHLRSTLCAHAALLLRSDAIVKLRNGSDPDRIKNYVKNFGILYARTDDADVRAGMLEDFESLMRLETDDVSLGKIDRRFFDGFGILHVPPTMHHVDSYFLGCLPLISVDLTPLRNVTSIAAWFLGSCSVLISLDVTPLKHVTKIRSSFLAHCKSLTELNFEQIDRIDSVESSFMFNCESLKSICLVPFSQIIDIPARFLNQCRTLTRIDLGPLSNAKYITGGFLSGCSGLVSLDLSPLHKVTGVGLDFLNGCSSLTQLDLAPLSCVLWIGANFLMDCTNIVQLDFRVLTKILYVDRAGFLERCHALHNVDNSSIKRALQ